MPCLSTHTVTDSKTHSYRQKYTDTRRNTQLQMDTHRHTQSHSKTQLQTETRTGTQARRAAHSHALRNMQSHTHTHSDFLEMDTRVSQSQDEPLTGLPWRSH